MKHTMKKLLCMAMAIMLLVSAVPVFAAAEAPAAATPTSYRVSAVMLDADNGNAQIGGSYNGTLNAGTKLSEVAYEGFASYIDESLYGYTYKMNGADANWGTVLAAGTGGAVEVTIYRSRIKYNVTLRLEGSTKADVSIQVNANETIDLNAKFSSNGLTADSGYYIQYYTKGDGAEHISLNYQVTENNITIVGHQTRLDNVQNPAPITPSNGSNNNNNSSNNNTNNGTSGSTNNGTSGSTNNGTSQDLGNGGTGIVNGSNTDRNRFPYDVVLHIYQNNKVDEPVKNIVINDSLAADGTVSLSEVKTEVMKYFSAKTSAGISYAGLYYARGNWVKDYATYNGEYDSITGIDSMRQVSQVDINVMITNATAKTTSTAKADSSNPKTGDTIFVPFMVMGVTATALAAAYVFGKKRIAR